MSKYLIGAIVGVAVVCGVVIAAGGGGVLLFLVSATVCDLMNCGV